MPPLQELAWCGHCQALFPLSSVLVLSIPHEELSNGFLISRHCGRGIGIRIFIHLFIHACVYSELPGHLKSEGLGLDVTPATNPLCHFRQISAAPWAQFVPVPKRRWGWWTDGQAPHRHQKGLGNAVPLGSGWATGCPTPSWSKT